MMETRMKSLSQCAQYRWEHYKRQSSQKACGPVCREQLSSIDSTFRKVACVAELSAGESAGRLKRSQKMKAPRLSAQWRASGFLVAHEGRPIVSKRHEAPLL